MQKIFTNKIFKQTIFPLGIFFAFLILLVPHYSHASMLSPGDISTCGELGVGGEYTLTADVTATGTTPCFVISADNVVINGNNHTITSGRNSTEPIAIDARARDGGPTSPLTEGANGYTNLSVNNLTITGFAIGIDTSGNSDNTGTGAKAGYGGDGGDVATYYANVGSVTTVGGNSTTTEYGGLGGNLFITNTDLSIANLTFNLQGGTGTVGRNTDGGLDLNYTGVLTRSNLSLSPLNFFNDNTTEYGIYPGGSWPILPGLISTCGTLYATSSAVFTLTQNISNIPGSCFTIFGNDITINGAGHFISAQNASTTAYAIVAGNYASTTLASTTVNNYHNLISSNSSVTISSSGLLDLSHKYIKARTLSLIYEGILSVEGATVSALINLIVNGVNWGAISAGSFPSRGSWSEISNTSGRSWYSIASSADGTKLAAVEAGHSGYIWTSIDSGKTWIPSDGTNGTTNTVGHGWSSIASSADGTKLVAVDNTFGFIWTSKDGGITWIPSDGTNGTTNTTGFMWKSVASSADGKELVAVIEGNGFIFTSKDFGSTWIPSDGNNAGTMDTSGHYWYSITSDASGIKLAAVDLNGYIWTSKDSGLNWSAADGNNSTTDTSGHVWYSITSSADGSKLAAVDGNAYIWTSKDGGLTWTPADGNNGTSDTFGPSWLAITSDASGTKLAAVGRSGSIWMSQDSGTTWSKAVDDSAYSWTSIVSDTSGNKLFAILDSVSIWGYSIFNPELKINILTTKNNLGVFSPIVSWGTAVQCSYSYDGNNFTNTSCSNYGASISASLSYGTTTLYARGTDVNDITITASSTFKNLEPIEIEIISPTAGPLTSGWAPNITWNKLNSNVALCQCSYDNFVNSTTTDCSLNGADIPASEESGTQTLSLRAYTSDGVMASASVSFSSGWYQVPNTYEIGSNYNWLSITSSADGTKLAAVTNRGSIYTSTNSGLIWNEVPNTSDIGSYYSWNSITSSADGTKLAAVTNEGSIYTSTDSGLTWNEAPNTSTNPNTNNPYGWLSITSSADGTKLAAVTNRGSIYTSTNSGLTWIEASNTSDIGNNYHWLSITSSADGTKLAAVTNGGSIYTSTNSGLTWIEASNTSDIGNNYHWRSITSSADGTKLAAVTNLGSIYTSTTSGQTWNEAPNTTTNQNTNDSYYWISITSSADGSKLAAVENYGSIYTSTDFGITWNEVPNTFDIGNRYDWQSITSSSDGTKLAAVTSSGSIYIYFNPNPSLSVDILTPVNNSEIPSWSPFVSWGISTQCEYSWDDNTYLPLVCSNNGTDIPSPSYGTSILYVRGTNTNLDDSKTASSTFTRNLPITISSPTSGHAFIWDPSINFNADNLPLNSLTCSYSYDNFVTSTSTDCSLNGSDIPAPIGDGDHRLSVAVTDGTNFGNASVNFSSGWYENTNLIKTYWYGIVSSADGTKFFAADDNNGYIWFSTNSGETWTAANGTNGTTDTSNSGNSDWVSITSSADGNKLAAVDNGGYIWTSVNSGLTWNEALNTSIDPDTPWQSITSSADGSKLVAGTDGGYIWTSLDYGITWIPADGNNGTTNTFGHNWESMTSSADGSKLVALDGNFGGYIWTSIDSGLTWNAIDGLDENGELNGETDTSVNGNSYWKSITSSADGSKLAAVDLVDYIWTSTDSGLTWNAIDGLDENGNPNNETDTSIVGGEQYWRGITSSANGQKLAAVDSNGYIWMSSDYGTTWIPSDGTNGTSDTSGHTWYFITSSADGNKLAVGTDWDYIWTYSTLNPELKVDILTPIHDGEISSWSPFISFGTAITCSYSYNGETFTSTTCANNGVNIPAPTGYGEFTLYAKGIDKNGVEVISSSQFTRNLPLTISSPTSGHAFIWDPSINFNADNLPLNSLTCSYSYDNFVTSTSTDCSLNGSDIPAPVGDGDHKLSAAVTDGTNLGNASVNFSSGWYKVPNTSDLYLYELTSSADGTKIVGTNDNDGSIYTSTDSGLTWNQSLNTSDLYLYSLTSSADGLKIVGRSAGNYHSIYTSTDSGLTWTESPNTTDLNIYYLASSADGTKVVGSSDASLIYTSTDSGVTWDQSLYTEDSNLFSLSSSADGTKIVGAGNDGSIYISTDSGVTWNKSLNSVDLYLSSLTSSSDGTKVVGRSTANYFVYTSSDSGVTWNQSPNTSDLYLSYLTSSADGTKVFGTNGANSSSYISIDSGVTWIESVNTAALNISYLNSSADGTILVGISNNNGSVYIYSTLNPELKVSILTPMNTGTISSWSPFISFGTAVTCSYSYNGNDFTNTTCANNGTNIPAPSTYGTTTLYAKGIDKNGVEVISSSTFTKNLPLTISSPTSGHAFTWNPSVDWNPDDLNIGDLICSYSYDNFDTSTSTDCSLNGSDIPAPIGDGDHKLSVRVTRTEGGEGNASVNFSSGWYQVPNTSDIGSNYYWQSITSSADGTRLAAVAYSGSIYTSTTSGLTWNEAPNTYDIGSSYNWRSITSSADGTKLAAVTNEGSIYTSTTSGLTWNEAPNTYDIGSSYNWRSITSSADGTKLAAVTNEGSIYTSTDSGLTWNEVPSTSDIGNDYYWQSITSSSDGTKLAAVTNIGSIYTYSTLNPSLSVDILTPMNTGTITSWSPFISFGTAITCSYSYNGTDFTNTTCANNGTNIPAPTGYGEFTLYAKGIDKNGAEVTSSSIFTKNLPLTITSPTSGHASTWDPEIIWNADNLNVNNLTCSYSYDNFDTSTSTDCSLNGSDIPAPIGDGDLRLSVAVTDGTNFGNASVNFSSGWYEVPGTAQLFLYELTSSADGTKLVGSESNNTGSIYTSTDSGVTWNESPNTAGLWLLYLTSSADGTKLVGKSNNDNSIYTSTDSGLTWNESPNTAGLWLAYLTSSADGTKLVGSDLNNTGSIHTSTNSGLTWNESPNTAGLWLLYLTSSADGTKLVGRSNTDNSIYTSADSGLTWFKSSNTEDLSLSYLTSSADGTKVVGTNGNTGSIYTSTDSGITWNGILNTEGLYIRELTSSADGVKLVGSDPGNYISVYTSTDSGLNWNKNLNLPSKQIYYFTSSADGNKVVAENDNEGSIWTYSTLNPELKVDILTPMNTGTISTWSPFISFGTAVTCAYSFDGNNFTNTICANNGTNIPAPTGYGEFTLYAKGIDKNGVEVTSSSTFTKNLPLTISSPTSGYAREWNPSVIWNADNLNVANLTCSYSYDDFITSTTISCSGNGSDIPAPIEDGNHRLSVGVTDGTYFGNASVNFSSGWYKVPGSTNDGSSYWYKIASSADGLKLAAVDNNNTYILTSKDGGLTWIMADGSNGTTDTSNNGNSNWVSITSDASGNKLVALDYDGYIWTSKDGGLTWIPSDGNNGTTDTSGHDWQDVVSDASGSKLAAVVWGGSIWTSIDSGLTWTPSDGTNGTSFTYGYNWVSITSDASGIKLAAVDWSGSIWTSKNSGKNWTQNNGNNGTTNTSGRFWFSITSSSDGTKLAAADENMDGYIWTSQDSGLTWQAIDGLDEEGNPNNETDTSGHYWYTITSSADGTRLSAVDYNGGSIWTSIDSGLTWNPADGNNGAIDTSGHGWKSITSSADGNKLASIDGSYGGSIWIYSTLNPELKVDILSPTNNEEVGIWSPFISFGTAISCGYNWNGSSNYTAINCANNGSEITPPSYGTSTLYVKGVDKNGAVVLKNSTFFLSYFAWYSTGDTDWNNPENWYTDINHTVHTNTIYENPIPTSHISAALIGSVAPHIDLDSWVEPQSIDARDLEGAANLSGPTFTSSLGNCTSIVIFGNAVFDNKACNNGVVYGNSVFNSAVNGTLTLTDTMKWGGMTSGTIKGGDGIEIKHLIFKDSSSNETTIGNDMTKVFYGAASNNGTIEGNVTFYNNRPFRIGTVAGTATLSGTNQTIKGINNVTNLTKQATVRDTLYLTSGSTLNISGLTTILGQNADSLLTIRSTTPNSFASLGINGTNNLNYLRIKDIHNTGANIDLSTKIAYNDGGNSGFTFAPNATIGSHSGGLANTYIPPTSPYVPPTPHVTPPAGNNNNNNNNNNRGGGGSGSFFAGGLANLGNLSLGNLPNVSFGGLGAGNNLGVSNLVNPLAGMLQLTPISGFSAIPKLDLTTKFDNFLNGSLPKSLVDLSKAVPSIKRSLTTANIRNGYDLYMMKESPIDTPTLTDLTKDKTKQPENLIFVSVDGKEVSTKLSIDKKGGVYQMITVSPYDVLAVSTKNTNKTIPKATWNGVGVKTTKDKNNIVKLSINAPKDAGVYILKVGTLTLEVKVITSTPAPANNGGVTTGSGGATNTQAKKLSPIQKLWSWFGK